VVRSIALLTTLLLVACQAPAPATPTSTNAPTAAVPKPAVSAGPSAVAKPSVAPSPSAVAKPSASPSLLAAAAAPPAGASRVEVLNAANSAVQRGDLTVASGLYERVINTPPTGENAQQTAAIDDFARFQATATLLASGNEDQAKTQLDALQKADPNSAFARLAAQLWDQYSMIGSVRGACSQLQPQIAAQAGPSLQVLQALGVSVDAQALCKLPS
jgi:hypothetical protein